MATRPSSDPKKDPKFEPIPTDPSLLKKLKYGTFAAYAALIVLGLMTWDTMLIPYVLNLGGGLMTIALVHFVLSLRQVNNTEFAARYFFGHFLDEVNPGLRFVPFGLMQIERESRMLHTIRLPGERERVFHGDDKEPLKEGMVRPIRVTTRQPDPKKGETGHLDAQMTLDMQGYVQHRIENLPRFIGTIGTIEHAEKLIRSTAEALISEWATRHTVNGIIESLPQFNQKLDNQLRTLTQNWGMQIYEAKIFSPDITHKLAEALRDVPKARVRGEQTRIDADADKYRQEQEGLGQAAAKKADLEAEAAGLAAQKRALGVPGEAILAAQVAGDAFKDANGVLMGTSSVAELTGVVAMAQQALEKKKGGAK